MIRGSSGEDNIDGYEGDDLLEGRAGPGRVVGGLGDDTVLARTDGDILNGDLDVLTIARAEGVDAAEDPNLADFDARPRPLGRDLLSYES